MKVINNSTYEECCGKLWCVAENNLIFTPADECFLNLVKIFLFKISYLNNFQSYSFNPSSFVTSVLSLGFRDTWALFLKILWIYNQFQEICGHSTAIINFFSLQKISSDSFSPMDQRILFFSFVETFKAKGYMLRLLLSDSLSFHNALVS